MANVLTPFFRVSYPNVFKPKKNELNGKQEYSLVALFPKGADFTALKAAAKEAIDKKWPKDKPANLKNPLRDQAERAKIVDGKKVLPPGYEEGAMFSTLKCTNRPGLVDGKNQDIINESDFYAGCWARASVNVFAYDQAGNRGVSFSLQNIQKWKDDEPLSGRPKASTEFAPVDMPADAATATSLFD